MPQIALITGATAGIGEATAVAFAKEEFNVIMTGRRKDRLETLKETLESRFDIRIHTLCFDVQDRAAVEKSIGDLPDGWRHIDVLVNNAGLALERCLLQDGEPTDWDVMIDTNMKGLLYVSHAVIPNMIERKKGHILNLSSIAGKQVYKNGNVYCATKHAVDALNKGMRIDLLEHNIRVTSINPGMVNTEFALVRFKGNTEKAKEVYEGFDALQPEDIADAIIWAATRPAHVNINEIIVMPTAQADGHYLQR
jgi:3-hydroxy acid dehydrogenase / malonic semialdehyde reductase